MEHKARRRHGWRHRALRVAGVLLAGLVGFYVLPVDLADTAIVPRGIVFVVAVAGLAWLFARQIRAQVEASDDSGVRLESLYNQLAQTGFVFAFAYYFRAEAPAGEFAGLATRTDALYFTVTTMVTVGFGDVHARGQLARGLVTAHMIFDVVFVSAFVSVLTARVRRRAEQRRRDQAGGALSSITTRTPAYRDLSHPSERPPDLRPTACRPRESACTQPQPLRSNRSRPSRGAAPGCRRRVVHDRRNVRETPP